MKTSSEPRIIKRVRRPRTSRRPLLERLEPRQLLAATIRVNTVDESTIGDDYLSFREAIALTNGDLDPVGLSVAEQAQVEGTLTPSGNTIGFAIPGTGSVYNISPTSALPEITRGVLIDGFTQGGTPNTNEFSMPDNAVLTINLVGDQAGDGADGLRVAASDVTIRGLAISGFRTGVSGGGNAIVLSGLRNAVEGNRLGFLISDAGGFTVPGNGGSNVLITEGQDNRVGDLFAQSKNVIAGGGMTDPSAANVKVFRIVSSTMILGNFIGVGPNGDSAAGGRIGVVIDDRASNTGVAFNIISGHDGPGVKLSGDASNAMLTGNGIGVDSSGKAAVPNGGPGVLVEGPNVRFSVIGTSNGMVGSAEYFARNIISGNGGPGIQVTDTSGFTIAGQSVGLAILGNDIGLSVDGVTPLPNSGDGVLIDGGAVFTRVGDPIDPENANRIAYNLGAGVRIVGDTTQGNTISGNVIFGNGRLGIDLDGGDQNAAGVNAPPSFPLLSGPNRLLSAPKILAAYEEGGNTRVIGVASAVLARRPYRVELYANPSLDPSGFGEGAVYLGSTETTSGGDMVAGFQFTFPGTLPATMVTAIITEIDTGNTSEFSAGVTVSDSPQRVASTTRVQPEPFSPLLGEPATFVARVGPSLSGLFPTGTVQFLINGVEVGAAVPVMVVNGQAIATYVENGLPASQNRLSARYNGDTLFEASEGSNGFSVKATGTEALTASITSTPNPSIPGQSVAFTITLTPPPGGPIPTGTVTIRINRDNQPPSIPLTFVNGKAVTVFNVSNLDLDNHEPVPGLPTNHFQVSIIYEGDSVYARVTSEQIIQVVGDENGSPIPPKLPTTLGLELSPNPVIVGQSISASVSLLVNAGPSDPAPTGLIALVIDGVVGPTQSISAGSFVINTSDLGVGSHIVSVIYSGDARYAAAASQAVVLEVQPVPASESGPQVVFVGRLGYHARPTRLLVRFNEALDPSLAANPRAYRILGAKNRSLRIASVNYNPLTNTATIRPTARLPLRRRYRLVVVAEGQEALRNTAGRALDGDGNGLPGGNFRTVVIRSHWIRPDLVRAHRRHLRATVSTKRNASHDS